MAALTEDGQKYPEYISYLQDLMQEHKMTFIVNRKFPRERVSQDMRPYLQELKDKGAKVIIGDFYDDAARAVMCDAYQLGMTARNGYVWFLPLWFTPKWYDTDLHNSMSKPEPYQVRCSTGEMVEAINGHFSLAYKFYADSDHIMQENKTVAQWKRDYVRHSKKEKMEMSRYGGYAYDAVWVYAMALDALFKENNSNVATLHSRKTSRRLVELLNETHFNGVTGPLSFVGSSRISDVIIWQWIQNESHRIGVYHPLSPTEGNLYLNESNIIWLTPSGQKPDDGSDEFNSCPVESLRRLLDVSCALATGVANILGVSAFLLFLLVAFIVYKRRYDKRMKKTEERMRELGLMVNGGTLALDEFEMPRDHIVINRKLGEGAFGTVFGGEAYVQSKWVAVAVKTLKTGAKPNEKLDFLSEAEIMKRLDNNNIVKLIGVCTTCEPLFTIMEFMLYGDLKTYLLSRRNLATEKDRSNNDEVSDKRLTQMALDIAQGLKYMSDLKYVHRDLACRNCLVNTSRTVKIADFGMCRAMFDSDYYRYNKRGMLPVRWMAPESLIDGLFSPMSDVWSYGVILYEIVTFASFPYQGLSNNEVLEYIKNYRTLLVPKGCKPELECLLLKCWSRAPQFRPHPAKIIEILKENPELVSPCLDVPAASVEVEDTGTLEIAIHDRSRAHSFSSSMWLNRKSFEQTQSGFLELNQISHNNIDNALLKQSSMKFPVRKSVKYETLINKTVQNEESKHCDPNISQTTYL